MNLIDTCWIPVIREDGSRCRIAPWQVSERDNPVVELDAPRPDFQGGLYQFLIGLLQTCCAPKDLDSWFEWYEEPPEPEELKALMGQCAQAFELFSEPGSPAFLQDLELVDGEDKPVESLLIEAPGGKTLKDNLDFFVKGGRFNSICPACAAQALFTLQTNAPSGGVGHRVGLRGGGPLTTLVMPADGMHTLWHKLWLNVLEKDVLPGEWYGEPVCNAAVLPWLAPARLSDKAGTATLSDDVNELQAYWGMPRRIRLQCEPQSGRCDLCGNVSDSLVTGFSTRNYGVNYEGPWTHPLTPYREDPKKEKPPLSLKGQKGGLSYRHWLGLAFKDDDNGDRAAQVVSHHISARAIDLQAGMLPQLWCFGFDLDNMKARCWYEHRLPLFSVPPEQADLIKGLAQILINCARALLPELRKQVKSAWFRRPEDHKGDTSMIDQTFWQRTEPEFYRLLSEYAAKTEQGRVDAALYLRWYNTLMNTTRQLFDHFTLHTSVEALDLKRVMKAREQLHKRIYTLKPIKELKEFAQPAMEEEAHG